MEPDDPATPLLCNHRPSRANRIATKLCGLESWKRRVPITKWLPKYSWEYLLRDAIAGITVGLTSIPQGIAYAIVAGLPPQVGLYSSIFPGLVYMIFGSCKDVTVGPTAILAALLAKYVAKSEDFAYLAAFGSGLVILLLGVFQLGFLLDFISKPVISGFTTAAALQIGAAQLKSLFRISGSSGDTFIHAIVNFIKNIKTVQLWDTVLGIVCIISLVLLKKSSISSTSTSTIRTYISSCWVYVVRARNALVVFAATILAYLLWFRGDSPFALTGKIDGGLPHFRLPPFSTTVGNQTLDFSQMLSEFGAEGLVMPLVAILESIAIAKAFAGTSSVDATQEMIAIGMCNVVSSCCQCMPATGSFTRTALNYHSGVVTPAGTLFKATLVLLSVTFLSKAFYFIPRATLAAIIMVAMVSIIDFSIIKKLWRNSKIELAVYTMTVIIGITVGLEYGILAGAACDAARTLIKSARPKVNTSVFKVGNIECVCISFIGHLSYAGAERIADIVKQVRGNMIVLDGRHLLTVDVGVAENLVSVITDLESNRRRVLIWNFPEQCHQLFEDLQPGMKEKFVMGPSIDRYILNLEVDRRDSNSYY